MISEEKTSETGEAMIHVEDLSECELLIKGNGSLGSSLRDFKSPIDFINSPAIINSAWAPARSSVSQKNKVCSEFKQGDYILLQDDSRSGSVEGTPVRK